MGQDFPTAPADGFVKWWGEGVRSWVYRASDGTWTRRAGTATARNRFINPAFQISQQNGMTDGTNVQGLVLADELYAYHWFTGGGSYRGQRVALLTPGGSSYRLRVSCTATTPAITPDDWLAFNAMLEASNVADFQWGNTPLNPQWAVVRFGWKSPAGTYCFGIRNYAATECYAYPFTVTPEQANTDTLQIALIPPNYWEVWPTGNAAWADCFWSVVNGEMLPTGNEWYDGGVVASIEMTNTFMSTIGNTAELFDIGFYLDPNITGIPPEWQMPHYEDALEECQRYWYRLFTGRGVMASAAIGYTTGVHPVPMRVGPAASVVGAPKLYDISAAPAITSISHNWADQTGYYMGPATAGGMTPGRPAMVLTEGAQYANYIAMSARM